MDSFESSARFDHRLLFGANSAHLGRLISKPVDADENPKDTDKANYKKRSSPAEVCRKRNDDQWRDRSARIHADMESRRSSACFFGGEPPRHYSISIGKCA